MRCARDQELARQSLRSEFAREFFVQLPFNEELCGPFGAGPQKLQGKPAHGITISAVRGLKSAMLMSLTDSNGYAISAEIPFSRVLSDVSGALDEQYGWTWILRDSQGETIFRQGSRAVDQQKGIHSLAYLSPKFTYRLDSHVSVERLVSGLSNQVAAWSLLALLLTIAVVKGVNFHFAARMSPERKMRAALRKRQIEPVIQPIVSFATGECLGGEILMRWRHPVRGLIPPAEFISQAEENGMVIPMSEMLMKKSRDQLNDLVDHSMYFSFNITAAQLRDPRFPEKILAIFDGTGLPPARVVLELTEREAIGEHDGRILTQLRALGFRIAIDDFGTGQSSLSMLQGLDIDRIKIDREFVRTIDESTERRPVLDTIILLGKVLKVPIIAEGIETQAQWDYLASRKVEAAQGYLIAKPMLIPEFFKWLQQDRQPFATTSFNTAARSAMAHPLATRGTERLEPIEVDA
jgi:EAL domain-containing protein (putative c-di-GMP-specific phosphodiesterase class I)